MFALIVSSERDTEGCCKDPVYVHQSSWWSSWCAHLIILHFKHRLVPSFVSKLLSVSVILLCWPAVCPSVLSVLHSKDMTLVFTWDFIMTTSSLIDNLSWFITLTLHHIQSQPCHPRRKYVKACQSVRIALSGSDSSSVSVSDSISVSVSVSISSYCLLIT